MSNCIKIPNTIQSFNNRESKIETAITGRTVYVFEGEIENPSTEYCFNCNCNMHIHSRQARTLRHIPFGHTLTECHFTQNRYFCPCCHATRNQQIPFKAKEHFITTELESYAEKLLAYGFTNKEVSEITGLNKNIIKDIDLKRLKNLYTVDGKTLIVPEEQARFLGIDEFKLHNGHKYATVIVNLENGHILWIAHGKKKQVIFDFIDHVGEAWMDGVRAVACDMNSDFQEAFEEKCQHIQVVFDYFHIIKNFNDKVISEVRRDEQKRLVSEGRTEEAARLKKTKYILTSSRELLEEKDLEGEQKKVIEKSGEIFKRNEVVRKTGYVALYESLIKENRLLFTIDLIKEKLSLAYTLTDEVKMAESICEIMALCHETGNRHFLWFERLLDHHFEGIIAHATYKISTSKLEGINNKIKTLRRKGYGYPDDDYFFLKLFDASRKTYVRNQKSHKI